MKALEGIEGKEVKEEGNEDLLIKMRVPVISKPLLY
jgi:hypothetical protein